ncbi:MAG: zinc-ribbon domain-containing protein [Sandaracinaceae bacterium]|nr:zinc-ribbon domain-containing protein [Myxococcales bacterium]MCB9662186.1 zinc-ribbon domain-containing protein [Sandaracinaceae bacterium]
MKIVCDSCSAKYSIADEKVAGKVFKIRCKKCSNVIVVRGDQVEGGNDEDEATRVFDYGGDAAWHLVLDGEQQGPFTPLQIAGMLSEGTVDYESYVWKEGFDGWKALNDVPELMAALGSGGEGADHVADDDSGSDPFAAASGGDAGALFGSEAAASAGVSAGGGNDLFASEGGGNLFGGGDDVVASTPSPRVSAGSAMTGQRNENSVLFSLSNLQALATGGEAAKPASKPLGGSSSPLGGAGLPASSGGMAMGEGSGLIDIRALASATAAVPAASPLSAPKAAPVDDLLAIGAGPSLGSALGAPVLAPVAAEPPPAQPAAASGGNNKVVLIAAAVAVLAAVGAVGFVLTRPPEIREVVTQAPAPTPTPAAETTGTTAAAPTEGTAPAAAPAEGTAPAEAPAATDDSHGSSGSSSSSSRSRGSSTPSAATSMSSAPAASEMTSSAPAATPAPSMTSSMSASIDDLLGMAVAPMESASADLPDTPSRSAVSSALGGRAAAVRACGNGTSGTATVAVTFASNGRVTSANVSGGPFAGNSCIANAVRGARVPPFRQATFNVNFPYRL